MPIPEKIILDIWEFIVQNYGMTCGIVCIFFALHLLWWERCRQCWQGIGHALKILYQFLHTAIRNSRNLWRRWKHNRQQRSIIAAFDRQFPGDKHKYTDYGKIKLMELYQSPAQHHLHAEATRRASTTPDKSYSEHLEDVITEERQKLI